MESRLTIAKSILMAIPAYAMETIAILKSLYDQIDGIVYNFIWGSSGKTKKPNVVKWDAMCRPYSYGDAGTLSLKDLNKAFLMNVRFAILTKPHFF